MNRKTFAHKRSGFQVLSFLSIFSMPSVLPLQKLGFALMAALLFSACGSDGEKKEEPQGEVSVRLRRVTVRKATLEKMELDVVLLVENEQNADLAVLGGEISASFAARVMEESGAEEVPTAEETGANDVNADAEGAENTDHDAHAASAMLADENVLDGKWHAGQVGKATAAAYQKTEVVVAVTIPFPTNPAHLDAILQWGQVEVAVKGDVKLASGTETFSGTRVIGLPTWPKILVGNVQVSSEMGGKSGEVYITMQLDNENPFDVRMERFDWKCTIGEKEMRAFVGNSGALAPAAATLEESDTFKLNDETYGPEVKKLLQQAVVPYHIEAFYEVHGVKKEFSFDGEMSFAR